MPPANAIQHLVVLMMENRSFDHLLGFLQSPAYNINGLQGNETNNDANAAPVQVSNDAVYYGDLQPDPGHAHGDVMQQMFGAAPPGVGVPNMSGFVVNYGAKTNDVGKSHKVMKCFPQAKIPILSTLAQQFCLCTNWYSSMPGPTFPNRAFAHAATSIGRVDMSPVGYVGISKTIYELLDANGVSATIFYNDTSLAQTFRKLWAKMNTFFADFQTFQDGCAQGQLPSYCFIEPRYTTSDSGGALYDASDQHPDHDVEAGEELILSVFKAIWKNPTIRNSTLLVITYDEHGGLFDHQAPPQRTVNPDGKNWPGAAGNPDPPFDFTWLGVRVPAVLVSPYIQPNTIDATVYDHTSFIATARKLFVPNWQNNFLTQRDLNANTFDQNLTLTAPRAGDINFPRQPNAMFGGLSGAQRLAKGLTEHQQGLVQMAAYMEQKLPKAQWTGTDAKTITTEGAAAAYLTEVMKRLRAYPPAIADVAQP